MLSPNIVFNPIFTHWPTVQLKHVAKQILQTWCSKLLFKKNSLSCWYVVQKRTAQTYFQTNYQLQHRVQAHYSSTISTPQNSNLIIASIIYPVKSGTSVIARYIANHNKIRIAVNNMLEQCVTMPSMLEQCVWTMILNSMLEQCVWTMILNNMFEQCVWEWQ